ncbi:MAG: hypothetical protein K1X54_07635 [Flavobacteriales bacterium]|nr:hypothetical protein [Flavobacteriales bacterium]
MKNVLPFFICLFACMLLLASCGNQSETPQDAEDHSMPQMTGDASNVDPLMIEIRDMEAKAKRDSVMDRSVGLRLLKAYQDYYNKHTTDSLGLACLFEAGRVADALGKYQKAIDLLINYHDAIANKERKAEAAYLVAFIYDAHIHDAKKATEQYNKVIELYPGTLWADQATHALSLVGKSDEELINMLEEKNKKSS